MVGISPALPDGKVYINPWGEIRVTGATVPDTAYTLRLTPGLTDVFGQNLETVQEWEFHVQGQPPLGRLHFPREMELVHRRMEADTRCSHRTWTNCGCWSIK